MRLMFVLGLLCGSCAFAAPQESRVPGGIALLPLPASLPADVQARYDGRPVFIDQNASGERHLVVGIPLDAPLGDATVDLQSAAQAQALEPLHFTIADKAYPEQHITLPPNDKHVHPSRRQLARYAREAKEQRAVYEAFSARQEAWPDFIMPTKGEPNPSFGKKRFFNGEPRAPHLGMDIPAPQGQAVVAPADGVVAQTGNYFFNGRTVMIDHGQGLVSMLCHLSKIEVKPGQQVKQGDVIGRVGHTGRATGPHLHWTASLNNARIDPLLLLPARTTPALEAGAPDQSASQQ